MYHWNWSVFWSASPDGGGTYLDTLLSGLLWTMSTALTAWILALVLGVTIGVCFTLQMRWVARLAGAYIEVFRNVPLLIQMFFWYFVLPELLPANIGEWIKSLSESSFYTAVVALGFYTSTRVAVQVVAGIRTLPRGQAMAAAALGFRTWDSYRYVLLPQALRIIIPPMTSEFIGVIKNSAVALTIGLMELTARTRAMTEFSFQTFEAFSAATLIYVVINIVVVLIMHLLERWTTIPGSARTHGKAGH